MRWAMRIRKGVIHCDIKPANIFMVGRTLPKVLDFGIARVAHGQDIPALEGVVAGSPHYLAPEQLRGDTIDRRCDVYSLGVVMYELLTQRKAFERQVAAGDRARGRAHQAARAARAEAAKCRGRCRTSPCARSPTTSRSAIDRLAR